MCAGAALVRHGCFDLARALDTLTYHCLLHVCSSLPAMHKDPQLQLLLGADCALRADFLMTLASADFRIISVTARTNCIWPHCQFHRGFVPYFCANSTCHCQPA